MIEIKFPGDEAMSYIPIEIEKRAIDLITRMLPSPNTNFDDQTAIDMRSMTDLELLATPKRQKVTTRTPTELSDFRKNSSDLIEHDFWAKYSGEYPTLSKLFFKLATIQPSSACVERLFSKAKLVFNDLKSSMSTETIFYNLLCE